MRLSPLARVVVLGAVALSSGGCAAKAVNFVSKLEVIVQGDAPGDVKHPAEVQIAVQAGALHLRPGAPGAHLLAGSVRSDDVTLLPHVTSNARGVAVVQDFTPEEGSTAKSFWDLALGSTPMRLFVHVSNSEEQHVDLGGRPITMARLYSEGGHLDVDWSAPNPEEASVIELWSIGYLDAHNVARAHAKRIEVKNVGMAVIDLGDHVDNDLRIDVVESQGTLIMVAPADTTARATLTGAAGVRVEAEGWRQEAPDSYTLGAAGGARRVTVVVRASGGLIQLRTARPTEP
jgi:hypothetical protein